MPDERFTKADVDPRPWHQKSPYAGVKDDSAELVVHEGTVYRGVNKTYTAEAVAEFHAGRRCGYCDEPFIHQAWPKECPVCRRDVKKAYDQWTRRFVGEEWVGSTINWRQEMDRLDDELERDNFAAEHTIGGVVIPKGVRA